MEADRPAPEEAEDLVSRITAVKVALASKRASAEAEWADRLTQVPMDSVFVPNAARK